MVFLLLAFSFSVGVAVSFLKTIADASFIIHFGIIKVPEAILLGGFIGYSINSLLTILYKKFGFGNVTTLLSIVTTIIITLFCSLLIFGNTIETTIYWLFIVSMPVADIIENVFNGTILRYLNYEQNKRLSGLLITGAVFSGILGCFLIPTLKKIFPSNEYLLLFSAFGCIMCLLLFMVIQKKVLIQSTAKNTSGISTTTLKLPLKSAYFWIMTAFILIAAGLFYIVNFGFLYLLGDIKKTYNADTVLLLIALMNGIIKLSEFVLSLVSGKILAKRGVVFGLSALPLLLLIFIFLAFVFTEAHQFWIFFGCIVMTKFVERVVRRGLLRPALNVMYQLFDENKSKVQHFLDGNIASLSAIVFGTFLYVLVKLVHDDLTVPFSFFGTIITGTWFILAIIIAVQYRKELFKKLHSIVPDRSENLFQLFQHSNLKVNTIHVKGALHLQLSRPMLLAHNHEPKPIDAGTKKLKENNSKLKLNFEKLIYLLTAHFRMETNPFYTKMSKYFLLEIEDEINKIGIDFGKKYNHSKLVKIINVIYKSDSNEEKLYAYELLTALAKEEDKKNLRILYNLITSSALEKSLFYHGKGSKAGLRNLMKSIISEESYSFSPILKACAIYVLGQNYVLKVPKEITDALNSTSKIVREMAQNVIIFDEKHHEDQADIIFPESWNIIAGISETKALSHLGNIATNNLYETGKVQDHKEPLQLKGKVVYLTLFGWIELNFDNDTFLDTLSDDYIELNQIHAIKISTKTTVLTWNSDEFYSLLKSLPH